MIQIATDPKKKEAQKAREASINQVRYGRSC